MIQHQHSTINSSIHFFAVNGYIFAFSFSSSALSKSHYLLLFLQKQPTLTIKEKQPTLTKDKTSRSWKLCNDTASVLILKQFRWFLYIGACFLADHLKFLNIGCTFVSIVEDFHFKLFKLSTLEMFTRFYWFFFVVVFCFVLSFVLFQLRATVTHLVSRL